MNAVTTVQDKKAKEWADQLAKQLYIPAALERLEKSDDSEDDSFTPKRGRFFIHSKSHILKICKIFIKMQPLLKWSTFEIAWEKLSSIHNRQIPLEASQVCYLLRNYYCDKHRK